MTAVQDREGYYASIMTLEGEVPAVGCGGNIEVQDWSRLNRSFEQVGGRPRLRSAGRS